MTPDDDTLPLSLDVIGRTVTQLHPPRWEPDEHLIEAALAGRVNHSHLHTHDRAWLIAHLTHRGHTTEVIAEWLHCSRRTVQMVRREPVAVLTMRLLAAEQVSARATSRADAARVTPAAISQMLADLDHLRQVRGRLIDQLAEMRRRCNQPADQIIIMRPTRSPRRRRSAAAATLPLFTLTEPGRS